MITVKKEITQDWNKEDNRCPVSKVVFTRYLFGLRIYRYTETFDEKRIDNKQGIGFNK